MNFLNFLTIVLDDNIENWKKMKKENIEIKSKKKKFAKKKEKSQKKINSQKKRNKKWKKTGNKSDL